MSTFVHSVALMDTVVTFRVPLRGRQQTEARACVERGVAWFRDVEARCSRFTPDSEVSRLAARTGVPTVVSDMVFHAVQFALALAEETGGAFDPTVGAAMEARGFNIEHRTGGVVRTAFATERATYRDVELDPVAKTITLSQPLMLDLGAVAKGLAVDLASRELAPFVDFLIDAGGDVNASGHNEAGFDWSIGIRHPEQRDGIIETLLLSNTAVCTSGVYERQGPGGVTHLVDPRTGESARGVASATCIAPTAMVADALATAAFVLGPADGIALLQKHGARGVLFAPDLSRFATRDD